MTVGVYGIFDRRDGSCLYVGQSKTIEQRWRQHVTKLKNKRKKALKDFVNWYHENGASEEVLDFRILEECVNDNCTKNFLESKWTHELRPRFGKRLPSLNESYEHSEETKAAIAAGVLRNRIPRLIVLCPECKVNEVKRSTQSFCSPSCHVSFKTVSVDLDLLSSMYSDSSITLYEICEYFQISGPTVMKKLKEIGIESRLSTKNSQKKLLTILPKEILEDLYLNQRLSPSDIAKKYNASASVIAALIERYKIPKKSFSTVMSDARSLKKFRKTI